MKKLLFLALIGLAMASCKKDQAQPTTTSTNSVRVIISNIALNNTYSIDCILGIDHLLTLTNKTEAKTYVLPVKSNLFFIVNWSFVKGNLQGYGTVQVIYKGVTKYVGAGYAGSDGFAIN